MFTIPVNNFIATELSSFYLDIAKDVVYIEGIDNKDRRAMQTVMYDTLQALLKLLTPIIPHTTDEMWSCLNYKEVDSVQLTDMPDAVEKDDFETLRAKWAKVIGLRNAILKALEEARNAKTIGKSLEAKVTVFADAETQSLLSDDNINFAQLNIVSAFKVGDIATAPAEAVEVEKIAVLVEKAPGEKCERCWSISETVGSDAKHPTLCAHCAGVVEEYYSEV